MAGVKKAFGWQTSQHLVRGASGMLVSSVVARSVGERGLGVLDSTTALINLIGGCAALGLQRIVTRELCLAGERRDAVKGTSLILTAVSCVIGALIANMSVSAASPEERGVMLCASVLLLVQPFGFFVTSVFESRGRLDLVGKVLFAGLIVSSLARIFLALGGAGLQWLALAYSVDIVVSCAAGWIVATRLFGNPLKGAVFKPAVARGLLRESLPLLLSSVAVFAYSSLDILMLKSMAGLAEAGVYGAAVRVSQIPMFIPGVLAGAFTARLMAAHSATGDFAERDIKTLTRLTSLLGLGVLAGGILLGPLAVRILYGESFHRAGPVLQVHVIGVFFLALGVMRNHLLILERKGRLVLLCDGCGAVCNVILNYLLIPAYGAVGSSWATVISFFLSFFLINFLHPELRKYGRHLFSQLR